MTRAEGGGVGTCEDLGLLIWVCLFLRDLFFLVSPLKNTHTHEKGIPHRKTHLFEESGALRIEHRGVCQAVQLCPSPNTLKCWLGIFWVNAQVSLNFIGFGSVSKGD